MTSTRSWRLAALTLAIGAVLLPAGPAAAATTPAPVTAGGATGVDAAVERSVVQLAIRWTGFINYQTATGYAWTRNAVNAYTGCTGFFVTGIGHIASAGHCVQPKFGREALIKSFLADQVDQGVLTSAEADGLVSDALVNWKVEGPDNGDTIQRKVVAYQPRAVPGAVLAETPLTAQLLDTRPFAEGDVALLKVETSPTPALPIATADPANGSPLTAVGFPGSVGKVVDVNRIRASFKSGTASSQQVSDGGVPQTEVNADISPGMSGGPTIDALGNVLGVNSFKIVGEDQNFNFITDTTDLRDWLTARGLTLAAPHVAPGATAGPAGRGLSGVALVGALAGVLVLGAGAAALALLVLRNRTTPAAPALGAPVLGVPALDIPALGVPALGVPALGVTSGPASDAPGLAVVPAFAAPAPAPLPVTALETTPVPVASGEVAPAGSCPNGHDVPAGQPFCGECGQRVDH